MKYSKSVSLILFLILTLLFSSCGRKELQVVRNMEINHINLEKIEDGRYEGEYKYGNYNYVVEVIIENHKFKNISLLKNRKTKHSKKASKVIPRIIEEQRNDVDVIAGATTTSKALLKAVENALKSKSK